MAPANFLEFGIRLELKIINAQTTSNVSYCLPIISSATQGEIDSHCFLRVFITKRSQNVVTERQGRGVLIDRPDLLIKVSIQTSETTIIRLR